MGKTEKNTEGMNHKSNKDPPVNQYPKEFDDYTRIETYIKRQVPISSKEIVRGLYAHAVHGSNSPKSYRDIALLSSREI